MRIVLGPLGRVLICFLFLTGCGGSSSAPAGSTALEKTSITLGWGKFAGNDVANRLPDFSKKYGLTITLQPVNSGPDLLTGLVTGQIDVALLTWTYLFQAQDKNIDVVAVASNIKKGTGLVVNKKLGLTPGDYNALLTLAQQRAASGKKLRFIGAKTSINFTLGYLSLKQHGIDVDKLMDIQDVPVASLHPQLMQQNAADLESTGEPYAAQAVLNGSADLFSYPYDTPAGALNTEFLALRNFVTKNPNTAKAFVNAVKDTASYLNAHQSEEATDVVNYTGLPQAVVDAALKDVQPNVQLDLNAAKALATAMFDQKIVQNDYSSKIAKLAYPNLAA
jgi:NitT/TauT family transport system substrate-binding protein